MEVDLDFSALKIEESSNKKRSYRNSSLPEEKCDNSEETLRRSTRKKIKPLVEKNSKRRVMTDPKKLDMDASIKKIENYYLDKTVKLSSQALETIFEEPKSNQMMSIRKFRRCFSFTEIIYQKPNKNKVKKRSMKAKLIKPHLKKLHKKIDLESLMEKLTNLDN
ncbi:hypothetical protein ABEB36_014768 [Hypothenemus hampei]|uniref:Tantalus-like domain-containing protein n=1 Tax=Hypothenemus hampei TaxID=57062 RepID=A0ABD1E5J6_HYPHA